MSHFIIILFILFKFLFLDFAIKILIFCNFAIFLQIIEGLSKNVSNVID